MVYNVFEKPHLPAFLTHKLFGKQEASDSELGNEALVREAVKLTTAIWALLSKILHSPVTSSSIFTTHKSFKIPGNNILHN